MSYTTLTFLIFIFVTILVYYTFPVKKYQWVILLAASYIFYFYSSFRFAFYILFTTITIWYGGLVIERIGQDGKAQIKANKEIWSREEKKAFKVKIQNKLKKILAMELVINFGILVFLKYYNFFAGGLSALLGWSGFSAPTLRLMLPLGISFYTFQAASYIIDVYRGAIEAEKNPAKFALFISFFPQIIQGPISEYGQLAHQLLAEHRIRYDRIRLGIELVLWGYFKKMVIADRAVIAINTVTADFDAYNGTTVLFTVLLYAFQLYADFSGGIDISRGIAQMLGIDMVENFRRPYFATSINDYWRRWHITLGHWMKNYIFNPLALSKTFLSAGKKMKNTRFGKTCAGAHTAKVLPTATASLIVFLLVGIWHGANTRYIGFGLWNGLIIMFSILLKPVFDSWTRALKIDVKSGGFKVFRILRTFVLVLVGYYFDLAPDFTGTIRLLGRSLTNQRLGAGIKQIAGLGLGKTDYAILLVCLLLIFIFSLLQEKLQIDHPGELISLGGWKLQWIMIFGCVLIIALWGIYGPGYDAANFVYMQF